MSVIRVFVYGTLKRGEPNHFWLQDETKGRHKFLGKGQTVERYPLVVATKYNIPFLLDAPGTGHKVDGEVYEIDEKMLANLDVLEEHPTFYVRRPEAIVVETTILQSWTYFLPKFNAKLLEKPNLTSYSSDGPGSLPYLESNNEATLDDLNDIVV